MRFVSLLLLLTAVPARAGELRVGASALSITPPVGTPMAGYYHVRVAEGVHDDLYAKALVLEKDGTKAALVALDLISTTSSLVQEAREQIERSTGVPGAHVMISATHAHTGPVLSRRGLRDDYLGGRADLVQRYTGALPATIARVVRQAEAALVPVRVSVGHGHEETLAYNRRYHMTDGTVGWNPGLLNAKILKPAGPIDPDVPVVAFSSFANKPLALYVNFAVHLDTIGGLQISADMPATLAKLLTEVQGPEMITLYTTGTCGDVNHINVQWGKKQGGFDTAARTGIVLAAAVLRTFPQLKPIEPGALRCRSAIVSLPLPKIEPDEAKRAREIIRRMGDPGSPQPSFLETVQAFKVLDVEARAGKPQEVEVQVIALGNDIAWVSLPGEIFVELGLEIKQDSPFRHTILAELANGSVGYVPARRAYAQGNYEVVSARCAEGSGERLVKAAEQLLKVLYLANAAGK
jgi:hypothetical protein